MAGINLFCTSVGMCDAKIKLGRLSNKPQDLCWSSVNLFCTSVGMCDAKIGWEAQQQATGFMFGALTCFALAWACVLATWVGEAHRIYVGTALTGLPGA